MHGPIVRLTAAMAGAVMLVACGGTSAPSSTATPAATPVTLNVGTSGVIDVAPLFLNIQKKFFAKQKITITPHVLQTETVTITNMITNNLQFKFSNVTSIV